MQLEDRLQQLQDRGKPELAEQLVKGVISSATDADLELSENAVHISHPRFDGEHEVSVDSHGDVDVEVRGEYVFTGDTGSVEIRVAASNREAIQFARENFDPGESSSEPVFGVKPDERRPRPKPSDSSEDETKTARIIDSIRQTIDLR